MPMTSQQQAHQPDLVDQNFHRGKLSVDREQAMMQAWVRGRSTEALIKLRLSVVGDWGTAIAAELRRRGE